MKQSKKHLAAKCLAGFLATLLPVQLALPALAANTGSTAKEEVIYMNLDAGGKLLNTTVVNIFDLEQPGQILDYGEYESVRNMTTEDPIDYTGDKITINADTGRLYYEGTMKDAVAPWNIVLDYILDGKRCPASDLAGRSGQLEIHLQISKNPESDTTFYDGYALQVALLLDTSLCSGIEAQGATLANVGRDKQITYTVLPGQGLEATVCANVTDFEMDPISINALPLSLDMEVDDAALMEQVYALQDAVAQLNDGAQELDDGASELEAAVNSDLASGTDALQNGAAQMQTQAGSLQAGANELESGAAALAAGTQALDGGIQSLQDGILQVQAALAELDANSAALNDGSLAVRLALAEIQAGLDGVDLSTQELAQLVAASAQMQQGLAGLNAAIALLQQNVSYDAYKTIMLQNGLDIDQLQQANTSTAAQLQSTIDQLNQLIALLQSGFLPFSYAQSDTSGSTNADNNPSAPPQDSDTAQSSSAAISDNIPTAPLTPPELTPAAEDHGAAVSNDAPSAADAAPAAEVIPQSCTKSQSGIHLTKLSSSSVTGEAASATSSAAAAALVPSTLISQLQSLVSRLQQLQLLLQANNAAIDGTNAYLSEVNGSITDLVTGAQTLAANYQLLHTGMTSLEENLSTLASSMELLATGIDTLCGQYDQLYAGTTAYTDAVSQICTGFDQITIGADALATNSTLLCDGATELYAATSQMLQGVIAFYEATGSLYDATGQLNAGVAELLTGVIALHSGATQLSDGTATLYSETDSVDEEISGQIDELLQSITGSANADSFVSGKNTNIKAVQFVIQTQAVSLPEEEAAAPEETAKTSFFDKLLALFGID